MINRLDGARNVLPVSKLAIIEHGSEAARVRRQNGLCIPSPGSTPDASNKDTMTIYQRLRSIGCTVETSDAIEPILGSLSINKREAFFLWACGMSEKQAGKQYGMSQKVVSRIIIQIRNNMSKIMIKSDIYSEGQ
jgi:predicted DNA-binding protein (UPF0251 family)